MPRPAPAPDVHTRATVIKTDRLGDEPVMKALDAYQTRQVEDEFAKTDSIGGEFPILSPPFHPSELLKLPLRNNTLAQCIAAFVVNIEGFGYTLSYVGPDGAEDSKAALEEKQNIEELLENANPDENLTSIRRKVRADLETLGWAAIEVGRDAEGNISWFAHIPGQSIRKTKQELNETKVEAYLKRGKDYKKVTIRKRMRRFVQIAGTKKTYFKEFGDPRTISWRDGKEAQNLELDDTATEVIWLDIYSCGESYGLPRYSNQLPSILGSREAEMTNLGFFQDNAIPALCIMVSGGMLTEDSVQQIRQSFAHRGRGTMNKVLVLEAKGVEDLTSVDGKPSTPRLDIKPLGGERQNDALFQEYDKNCSTKIRSAFRLPPIFLGLSEDYTRATAESSLEMAEGQVFAPERNEIDRLVNTKLLLRDGKMPEFWRFKSNPARIASTDAILKSLESFNKVGAMTPNIAIGILNSIFGMEVPKIEEPWGDEPYSQGAGATDPNSDPDGDPEADPATGKKKKKPSGALTDEPGSKGKAKGRQPTGTTEKPKKK